MKDWTHIVDAMTDTFLSAAEIQHMTGKVRPKAQLRFLHDRLGILDAFINGKNQVVVYRAWIDKGRFQSVPSGAPMPDFDAMDQVA